MKQRVPVVLQCQMHSRLDLKEIIGRYRDDVKNAINFSYHSMQHIQLLVQPYDDSTLTVCNPLTSLTLTASTKV
jgi:hypothetical protein